MEDLGTAGNETRVLDVAHLCGEVWKLRDRHVHGREGRIGEWAVVLALKT